MVLRFPDSSVELWLNALDDDTGVWIDWQEELVADSMPDLTVYVRGEMVFGTSPRTPPESAATGRLEDGGSVIDVSFYRDRSGHHYIWLQPVSAAGRLEVRLNRSNHPEMTIASINVWPM